MQDSQLTELTPSQILDRSLGCVLLWNTAATCDIAAYKFPPRSQYAAAAIALTAPKDSIAAPLSGVLRYGQQAKPMPNQVGYFLLLGPGLAAAALNSPADQLMPCGQYLAATVALAPPENTVTFSLP